MGPHQDITNINITGEDALHGGAGGAAVPNDVNSDLGQVAWRRIGALATRMSMVASSLGYGISEDARRCRSTRTLCP